MIYFNQIETSIGFEFLLSGLQKKYDYFCSILYTNLTKLSQQSLVILGIESSCDDTSAAILKDDTILSNVTATQAIHEQYGGVVPELASRAHQQNIIPVVDTALKKAALTIKDIDLIAFTQGPGLMGSLVAGTAFAKMWPTKSDSRKWIGLKEKSSHF